MSVDIQALLTLFPERQPALAARAGVAGFAPIRGPRPYHTLENVFGALGVKGNIIEDDGHVLAIKAAVDAVRADPRWGPIYRGDLSDYRGDNSRADLALCGEFARRGLNACDIDIAFRTSALYRDKWERDDYRNKTIATARPNASTKPDQQPNGLLDPHNGKIAISTAEPLPRDWTIEGLLLPRKSAVLAGFGGVSKTQLAIQSAIAIVLGSPFMGRAVKSGGVILILGEEDSDEIARRVNAVVRHQKFNADQIRRIEEKMLAFGLVGLDTRLTATGENGLTEQKFARDVIVAAKAMGDVRLIVHDHLALIHGGDFNAREDAALTMRVVNHIAQETGASVLVLAHTPKSANESEASDASMVAGSTAFVDQARGAWVLATMRDKEAKSLGISSEDRKQYASLAIVKNNYGPSGDVIWFKRVSFDGVGLLEHVNLSAQATTAKAVVDLEARVVEFVRSNPGQYSKTRLRDSQSGKKDGRFKASKGELERAIEALLKEGRLMTRPPSDQECATFGHGPRVSNVLDVGP